MVQPRLLDRFPAAVDVLAPADLALLEAIVLEVAEEHLLVLGMRLVGGEDHHAGHHADLGVEKQFVRHRTDRLQRVASEQLALQLGDPAALRQGGLHRHDGNADAAGMQGAQIALHERQFLHIPPLVGFVRRIEHSHGGLEAGDVLHNVVVETVAVQDAGLAILMHVHVGYRQRIDAGLQFHAVDLRCLDAAFDGGIALRLGHHLLHGADQEAAGAGAAVVDDGLFVHAGQLGEELGDVRRRQHDAQPLVAVGMAQKFDVERAKQVAELVRPAEGVHVVVYAADDFAQRARLGRQHRRRRQEAERLLDDGKALAIHPGVAQALQGSVHRHSGERLRLRLGKVGALEGWAFECDEYGADQERAIPLTHLGDVQRVVEFLDELLQRCEVLPVLAIVVAIAGDVVLRREQLVAENRLGLPLRPQLQEVRHPRSAERAADGDRQHVEAAAELRGVVERAVHCVLRRRVAIGALVLGNLRLALDHRQQLRLGGELDDEVRPAVAGAGLRRPAQQFRYAAGLRLLFLDRDVLAVGGEVGANQALRLSFVCHRASRFSIRAVSAAGLNTVTIYTHLPASQPASRDRAKCPKTPAGPQVACGRRGYVERTFADRVVEVGTYSAA